MKNKYLEKLTKDIKKQPADYDASLNGVKGWMIFVLIFRFLTLILALFSIRDNISYLGQGELQYYYAIFNLAAYIPFEVIIHIAIIILIFKKDILFRKLFVIYAVSAFVITFAGAAYLLVAYGIVSLQIIIGFIANALWIWFFYKSVRIKNTYIYPYADFKREEKVLKNKEGRVLFGPK